MLVLTSKYSSQIDLDLLKKQKDKKQYPLINHRKTLDLNLYKDIKEAYLAFLDNKDKYVIGYKPKAAYEINEFVKSLDEIDTLDVSWIDVSELKSLSGCFRNCEAKHIIGLDKWDVSNVENMWCMFYDCEKLERVEDISGWNVSNVDTMDSMFERCKNLERVGDISGWDVSNVRNMWCMFRYCENITSIGDLNRWKLQNNVDTKDMFYMSPNIQRPAWYHPY